MEQHQIRYFSALVIALFGSRLVRNHKLANPVLSVAITLCAFGVKQTQIFYAAVGICLFATQILYWHKKRIVGRFSAHILMLISMICLLAFKFSDIDHPLDISGPLMLLCIKFYYIGVGEKKSMKNLISYVLFVPGYMAGPVIPYDDFINKKTSTDQISDRSRYLAESLGFLVLHLLSDVYISKDSLMNHDMFLIKIVKLAIFVYGNMCKYFFVWKWSTVCYSIAGYSKIENIKPMNVITAGSVKDLSKNWNIYTNKWLKASIFIILQRYGNFFASLATFCYSALWHGIHLGYFTMFITFSLCVPILNNNSRIFKRLGERTGAYLSILQIQLFCLYFPLSFFIFEDDKLKAIRSGLYYYGHVYITLSMLLFCACSIKRIIWKNKGLKPAQKMTLEDKT